MIYISIKTTMTSLLIQNESLSGLWLHPKKMRHYLQLSKSSSNYQKQKRIQITNNQTFFFQSANLNPLNILYYLTDARELSEIEYQTLLIFLIPPEIQMSKIPQKPGMNTGKPTPSGKPTPGATATGPKGTDPKHLPREFKDQFLKKLQACSNPLDYNDDTKQIKEKNDRQTFLQEFNDYLNDQNCMSTVIIPHLDLVINMVEKNIFRPLPVLKKQGLPGEGIGMEEEEALADPAWPHLQPVYEFFLQLIVNDGADVKALKVHITPSFIQEFLELFDSEEPREREYLKNILHRLYAKLVPRRKMIRKAINDCFYSLIHETFKFNGASELLDILASIISGFAVPLREEHIIFFKNVIIPLHKVQTCHLFHEHLMRCSMLFLAKDPSLGLFLLDGLIKYWPFANSPKEVMFISELIEVLETCEVQRLEPYIPKVFKRLVKCISGLHLQVADRAMCFFENDYFLNILKTYKSYTFPLLVPVIVHMAETHWHKVLQESLNALKAILKEIDPQAFEKALEKRDQNKIYLSLQDPKTVRKEKAKMDEKWKTLLRMAQQKNSNLKEPVLPYADTHVVGDFNGINNGNVNIS